MRSTLIRVTAVLLLAGLVLAAGGCCTAEKNQINALKEANLKLEDQNKDLRSQLSRAQMSESQLLAELQEKKSDLSRKDEEIDDLQTRLSAGPEVADRETGDEAAEGWERGLVGDKVTVGSDVLFSPGRATLTNAGKQKLQQIVRQLKTTYSDIPVRVYGYTDSDPIVKTKKLWADNLDLSANRAMAVTRYLRQQGVEEDRIETIGMGATNFVASNKTKDGKAKNRRVEIIVVRN
ncbi:MAG: flagellar motor protein MotB [Phycisphaerae bacterium]